MKHGGHEEKRNVECRITNVECRSQIKCEKQRHEMFLNIIRFKQSLLAEMKMGYLKRFSLALFFTSTFCIGNSTFIIHLSLLSCLLLFVK
jgi:hypothetical protein